jgi:DNA-binding PucR family transcriptional regulator
MDRGYLEWLLKQKEADGENDEDWLYTLRYYLKK